MNTDIPVPKYGRILPVRPTRYVLRAHWGGMEFVSQPILEGEADINKTIDHLTSDSKVSHALQRVEQLIDGEWVIV